MLSQQCIGPGGGGATSMYTVCPRKYYNQTFHINNYSKLKYRIDQNVISGYETITYYLPFAENRIRFGQVVTQKY